MADLWFTMEGEQGSLRVTREDDSWYVVSPDTDTPTKCIFTGDEEPLRSTGGVEVTATVSRYAIGTSGSPNYAFLTEITEERTISTDAGTRQRDAQSARDTGATDSNRQGESHSQSDSVQSDTDSTRTAERGKTSLDKIAQEKLSDEEFTLEQEDASLVGNAKRKAKSQGRDPAIDPRLQQHGEREDDETS